MAFVNPSPKRLLPLLLSNVLMFVIGSMFGSYISKPEGPEAFFSRTKARNSSLGSPVPDLQRTTLPQPNAIAKPAKTELKPLMDGYVLSVGADGVLNSAALALLRISGDQAKQIQEAMNLAKLKLFELATKNTKIDKLRTTETTSAFIIPSFEAEGIQIREEFETEIKKVLPPETRDDFLQFFPFHQFAGGFGSNEILLEMVASDVGDTVTGFQAKYEFRDAAGQVSTSGFMPMSKVKELFGVGFNIED